MFDDPYKVIKDIVVTEKGREMCGLYDRCGRPIQMTRDELKACAMLVLSYLAWGVIMWWVA